GGKRPGEAPTARPSHQGHGRLTGSPIARALPAPEKRRLAPLVQLSGAGRARAIERTKNRLPCGECPAFLPERRNTVPALWALRLKRSEPLLASCIYPLLHQTSLLRHVKKNPRQ